MTQNLYKTSGSKVCHPRSQRVKRKMKLIICFKRLFYKIGAYCDKWFIKVKEIRRKFENEALDHDQTRPK